MELNLKRPLVVFDIESTGLNITEDRIIELSYVKVYPDGHEESNTFRFNPERVIPQQAIDVHGITNEDLKDEIYYYFNSKYAREGYKTDNDEEFSLLDETDRGRVSSFDILYKYMRVVDSDVIGVSGSPKDNIKHLQGAVRLIRRGTTDTNAALCFLNVYCLLALKVGSNKNMREELESSFIEGYLAFKEQEKNDTARQNTDSRYDNRESELSAFFSSFR